MAEPFIAEIRIFPFNFPPQGWALCNGQLLPISQNTALFSLLGTTYGGDGKSTFALPNLQGRTPMHPGQGKGLSLYDLGEGGGSDTVELLGSEMPPHSHNVITTNDDGNNTNPSARYFGRGNALYAPPNNLGPMAGQIVGLAGGSQPHNNMQPYLTLNFCIALQGIYPPRS